MNRRFKRVLAFIFLGIGLVLIGIGAKMTLPDFFSLSDYKNLSERVHTRASSDYGETEDEPKEGEDTSEEDSQEESSIDWDALRAESEDVKAWVMVEGTDIDFPVLQGTDNDYYLYHDIFGRESYANVFLDYRADPNGRNCIIYGHTHWADTGFHQIAETDEQWRFDEIGLVHYFTPEAGELTFTPVAALHVYPQFEDVQEFEWEADASALVREEMAILSGHAINGDWNQAVLAGQGVSFDASESVQVDTGRSDIDHWWVLTEAEKQEAARRAQVSAFRDWLHGLCAQGDARRSDCDELIATSERCVVLACCSWPFDSHRTLLVCVR